MIQDNTSTANCTGNLSFVGGIVGSLRCGNVKGNTSAGNVSGGAYSGGIIGAIAPCNSTQSIMIDNNKSTSVVTAEYCAGGIVGLVNREVAITNNNIIIQNNSHTSGNVTATNGGLAGGIIGYLNNGGIVKRNYSNGNVTINQWGAGGIIGSCIPRNSNDTILIEENYSLCNVSAVNNTGTGHIGGLIGSLYTGMDVNNTILIQNNYFRGNVSITQYAGAPLGGFIGIVGHSSFLFTLNVKFQNNYAVPTFTGNVGNASGFVGYKYNTETTVTYVDNYWQQEGSGITAGKDVQGATVTGVSGITAAAMKPGAAFSGWSTSIWTFVSGQYPKLSWEL